MKLLSKLLIALSIVIYTASNACDRTTISVTNVVYDGTLYTYTAQVCIGISPNWGGTPNFCIDADQTIVNTAGSYTSSFTSTYNYCTATLLFNGQGCATTAMGAAPAGGTVQTYNETISGSVSGGNLCFDAPGGGMLSPDDLVADCADCGNPTQLCWNVNFSTTTPIGSVILDGAEGGANCPDELDVTIPAPPPPCSVPVITGTVNTSSSVTVCEGETVALSGNCTSNCDTDKANNIWTGPDGYSYTASGGGAASFPLTDAPTVTSSGAYTYQNGSGTCLASTTVNVTVIPAPTAALNTAEITGCTTVDVPVTFTGTGPWTFTYNDGSGNTSVTTSSNPYMITGLTSNTTVAFAGGSDVESAACTSLSGVVSGSTNVEISTVNSAAGDDWVVLANTNQNLNGTGTSGLDGYDITTTPVSSSNTTSGTFLDNDPVTGFTAGNINISSFGLTCGTMTLDNIPTDPICFTYTGSKSSNIMAELCLGATCITVPTGGISASPYCFSTSDVFTLLNGASCSSGTLSLQVWDVITGSGKADDNGVFTGWIVNLNDYSSTIRTNPTYLWTALSGDASTGFLSCTTCEDPIFNSPTAGAGCYQLAVTDGFGCTDVSSVCYTTLLNLNFLNFDIEALENNQFLLTWETEKTAFESFSIEKSTDNMNFEKLSSIDNSEHNSSLYSFVDENPENENYYRIKGMKSDGQIEYSESKFISLNHKEGLLVNKVYPTPTFDILNAELISENDISVSYDIIDLTGKKVVSNNFEMVKGNKTLKIDVSGIESGVYMFIINSESDKQFKTKVVKK